MLLERIASRMAMGRTLAALVILAATATAVAQQDVDPVVKKAQDAKTALDAGRFDDALALFKDAQIERPEAPELDLDIGLASYKLGKFDDAVTAFTKATRAKDKRVEAFAWFHLGNTWFRQGKLENALEAYNQSLRVEPNDEDARFNREIVIRHIKEKARQKKDEQRKQDIAKLLQELIAAETTTDRGTRLSIHETGEKPPPIAVRELEAVLDVSTESRPTQPLAADALKARAKELTDAQAAIVKKTDELIAAIKLETETKPTSQPTAPSQDAEKYQKVLPLVAEAREALQAAQETLAKADLGNAVPSQDLALTKLLEALDILMDELTRIIRDQGLVLADTAKAGTKLGVELEVPESQPTKPPAASSIRPLKPDSRPESRIVKLAPDAAAMLDPLAEREDGLKDRTDKFAVAVEQMLQQMKATDTRASAPGGQAKPADPHADGPKPADVEEAIKHLQAASDHLIDAKGRLTDRTLQPAFESEFHALRELLEAKQKLSPMSQGQDQQQQDEKNQDDKKDDQKQDQKNDKDQQNKDKKDEAGKKPDEKDKKEMSKEEAEALLDRMKQQEKEYRDQKKAQPKGAKDAPVKKDW